MPVYPVEARLSGTPNKSESKSENPRFGPKTSTDNWLYAGSYGGKAKYIWQSWLHHMGTISGPYGMVCTTGAGSASNVITALSNIESDLVFYDWLIYVHLSRMIQLCIRWSLWTVALKWIGCNCLSGDVWLMILCVGRHIKTLSSK